MMSRLCVGRASIVVPKNESCLKWRYWQFEMVKAYVCTYIENISK